MRKNAKLGRSMTTMCAAFMYGGGFFYHTIMPLSAGKMATAAVNRELELSYQASNDSGFEPHGTTL